MEPDAREVRGKSSSSRGTAGKGKANGPVARSGRPTREPVPAVKVRGSPGSKRNPEGSKQSPAAGSRTRGRPSQQQLADVVAGHEHLESRIEAMGRQLFTDTKKRCEAKEKLDREAKALEELRHELEHLSSVVCPVCNERFAKREIQSHVDSCLSGMLDHIEQTVERAPGVQRALRPRLAQEDSAGEDHYDEDGDHDDGDSLTSFDLEGSTGPDGTVWTNPLTRAHSRTRNQLSSWTVGAESTVRQQREERRRQRQELSPSRPYRRSPQRERLEPPSLNSARWASDPPVEETRRSWMLEPAGSNEDGSVQLVSRSRSFQRSGQPGAFGVNSVDDAQERAPLNTQAINRSWADRHPGLAKLVASADTPLQTWEAVPGVAAASPAENLTHHSRAAVVDIKTGGRYTAITPVGGGGGGGRGGHAGGGGVRDEPSRQFNAQYWREHSDNPREWSTTEPSTPQGSGQASTAVPGVPEVGQAFETAPSSMGAGGMPGAEPLPLLPPPPPPPPSLELTVSANSRGQANLDTASNSSQRSVAAELRDLQSLQAEGMLTTEEFEALKKAVLERGLGPGGSGSGATNDSRNGRAGEPYAWQAQLDSLGWGA